MDFGVIYPTTELPSERDVVRRWAQAMGGSQFTYVQLYDHTVLVDPEEGETAFYTRDQPFHEPLVLGAYLAALTDIEISTGVLILPQRQTVLVAKQVAELDILTAGKVRLGIGIGWAEVEYRALGANFGDRGRRVEEQIDVMRQLWSGESVDFTGEFHEFARAALVPPPTRPRIPVWIGGGGAPRVLERVGRLADGWIPNKLWRDFIHDAIPTVRQAAGDAGRDPDSIGIQGLVEVPSQVDAMAIEQEVETWRGLGATHISFLGAGADRTPDEHFEMIAEVDEILRRIR